MVRCLVLATGNPGKLREIREILGEIVGKMPLRVVGLDRFGRIGDFEEIGATFAENARAKARYYARATGEWALADDSGLSVDALGGAPGVHSARYASGGRPVASPRAEIDLANNAKLLEALRDVPDVGRTARFVCHMAMADGERVLIESRGVLEGTIARECRGDNGFGYDPLLFVPAMGCTTAQMSSRQKSSVSHRGQAARSFAALLNDFLARRGQGRLS